jgi:hypothetical protein
MTNASMGQISVRCRVAGGSEPAIAADVTRIDQQRVADVDVVICLARPEGPIAEYKSD